jgi:hypothetical protein
VLTSRRFSVRELMLAGVVGLIIGCAAFLLTAQTPALLTIDCSPGVSAGFDPLTGSPHVSINCAGLNGPGGQSPVAQVLAMPPDLASRRAIPVPLGFVLGLGLTFGSLAAHRARGPSEPGADSPAQP